MNINVYPKNYFSPLDDLPEIEEEPIESRADKQAVQIVERLHKSSIDKSQRIFHPTDYRTMYFKLLSLIELEFAELIEYSLKLEEKNR